MARFHSDEDGTAAEARFDSVHKHGEVPEDMPEVELGEGETVHLPALLKEAFGVSSSEARRLIAQGGVKVEGEPVAADVLDVPADDLRRRVIQVGKRRFARLI